MRESRLQKEKKGDERVIRAQIESTVSGIIIVENE